MPPILDMFNGDGFNMASLTTSVNKLPFVPSRIGAMGIFKATPIRTKTAVIEEKSGTLSLLETKPRGVSGDYAPPVKRTVRSFIIPHIPYEDTLYADDLEGIRAFGSESELQQVNAIVNDRLEIMRQDHEVTLEHLRAGAIQGKITDADGSTVLYNLFTEFGVTETSVDFVLGTTTTNIQGKCLEVIDAIELALGAAPMQGIHALCHKVWFRDFIGHTQVRAAYARFKDGEFLRGDPRKGFQFAGITFEEYRGKVNGVEFIPSDNARFFPIGVPNLYQLILAPAPFMETVNTPGKLMYAKQKRLDFDIGIRLHTQSNPLPMCTIPKVLVKGTG